jgi:hypothetical protein
MTNPDREAFEKFDDAINGMQVSRSARCLPNTVNDCPQAPRSMPPQ